MARHKELVAQGWVRQFTAEEPRLSEAVESYRMIGMEVHLEPGAIGEEEECRSCFDIPGYEEKYQTIYTRGLRRAGSSEIDELFD